MTVRFLTCWNGYSAGDRATLSAAIETTLISGGIARADYVQDGASPLYPPNMGYAAAVVGAARRADILSGASSGTDSGWLPISLAPERLLYQLDSGSTPTTFAVDISADGVTSLGQAFTGAWSRSDIAYITGLISYSNPLAKYFRLTVLTGGPLSMQRYA